VPRPLQAANITAAATYRTIELAQPTLLVDEADTFLNKSDDLRGILNAGHRKGGGVVRLQGENHEPVKFSAWSPVAIAAIGRLPPTLADRSIEIRMRRRRPYEKIERLRTDRMEAFRVLARKIARWATDNAVAVSTVDPEIPELMSDRAADNWRSLLAIAEVIGGEWPARAKSAALILAKAGAQAGHSEGVQLLKDIRTFSNERKCESYFAETLVQYLVHLEERPWAEFRNNRPLTKTQLAKMLTAYGISSGTIRIGDKTAKGYYAERFKGAFARYLPAETVTPSHPARDLDKS
jgi:putative DNA primase/helicase